MEYGKLLIDRAAEKCGGQNALAKQLGFSKGTLSDMKSGRKAISPATAAELADIAGEDVEIAIRAAIIESVQGTRRESKIREILSKGLAAGVVAMLATSYNGAANGYTAAENKHAAGIDTIQIVLLK